MAQSLSRFFGLGFPAQGGQADEGIPTGEFI